MNPSAPSVKSVVKNSGNFTVKVGHITIPVYHHPPTAKRKHESFTVSVFIHGHRIRGHFAKKPKAIAFAELQAAKIKAGEAFATKLNPAQAASFFRAQEHIRPYGKPIELVCAEWAESQKILKGKSVVEASRLYAKVKADGESKTATQIYDELIRTLTADGASDKYLKDLKGRLPRFVERFPDDLTNYTGAEIDTWLRTLTWQPGGKKKEGGAANPLPIGPRSRNNYRSAIQTLVAFAKDRQYIPRDLEIMEGIPLAKEPANHIEIFTVDEINSLLIHAGDKMLPFIAIAAFSGVRHEEIVRLKWENIQWETSHIVINAEIAKKRQRRLVPLQDNLKSWLLTYRNRKGPICALSNVSNALRRAGERAGFKWKHNALRHSYTSYRVAETKNVAQVALETGNSPRMIFSNYLEMVTEAESKRWFNVMRPVSQNIHKMKGDKN